MAAAEDWWGEVSQESVTEEYKADLEELEKLLVVVANGVEAVVVLVKDWDLDWELESE